MNTRFNGIQGRIPAYVVIIVFVMGGVFAASLAFERFSHGAVQEWAATFSRIFLLSLGTIAVYSLLERMVPAGPHKSVKACIVHLQVTFLYLATIIITGALAALLAGALSRHFELGWIDLQFAAGNGVVALVGAMLVFNFVFDFFYYWFHRFQHVSQILWQEHKFHHMDEQLNVMTTVRQHWLEELLQMPAIAIPMAIVFKLDSIDPFSLGLAGASVGVILGSWGYFVHSNLKLHLGWATRLFAGPQVHRVHHSRLEQHRDRNFAAMFPIWDILFGTYYSPARNEFPPTGVDGEKECQSFGEVVIFPFREWRRMFREWRRRKVIPA